MARDAHWDAMISVHGTSATWKSGGTGTGEPVDILWDQDSQLPEWEESGKRVVKKGVAEVNPDDYSPDIAHDDTFTIDSVIYAVAEIEPGPLWVLQLVHYEETYLGGDNVFGGSG